MHLDSSIIQLTLSKFVLVFSSCCPSLLPLPFANAHLPCLSDLPALLLSPVIVASAYPLVK